MSAFALAALLIPAAAPGVWDARALAAERDEVLGAMSSAGEYTVDFTIDGVKETARLRVEDKPDRLFFRRTAMGEWLVGPWSGSRVIPLILSTTCAGTPGGAVRAVVRLLGRPAYTLRTRGLAEDLYLLRCLPVGERFADWVKKVTPAASPDVLVFNERRAASRGFEEAKKKAADARPVEMTKELAPAAALAAEEYARRRAELITRLGGSYLFYPKSPRWALWRDGDALFATAGCHDRMYHARFTVELKRDGKTWKFVRLLAEESFKGE